MKWWLPVILMTLIAPFTPAMDLAVSRYFFNPEQQQFASNAAADFLFAYGPKVTLVASALSVVVILISYFADRFRQWRNPALLLLLTVCIGSGLIVNVVLKDHWGRPRPKQVVEFGGTQQFRPFYDPNFFHQPEESRSFPCGHCSMGFAFFALGIIGRRMNNKWICYFGFAFAFVFGATLSLARLSQGGHFLSDTLMSGLIMWLTALICDAIIHKKIAIPNQSL